MVPRSLGGLNQIFLGRPLLRTQSFWFGTARLLLWSPSFKSHKGEDTIFLEFYKGEKIARPLLKTRSFSFGAARLLQHTRPSRKYPTRLLVQPAGWRPFSPLSFAQAVGACPGVQLVPSAVFPSAPTGQCVVPKVRSHSAPFKYFLLFHRTFYPAKLYIQLASTVSNYWWVFFYWWQF